MESVFYPSADTTIPAVGSPGVNFMTVNGTATDSSRTMLFIGAVTSRIPNLDEPTNPHYLSTQSPYFKGFAETFRYSVTNGVQFRHRRIVFFTKDPRFHQVVDSASKVAEYPVWWQTPTETRRAFKPFHSSGVVDTAYRLDFLKRFFQGELTIDYPRYMEARPNNQFANVVYDKTLNLSSPNDRPATFTRKFYHPIEKYQTKFNLERGDDIQFGAHSTSARQGCGDMYVVDIFGVPPGANESDTLEVQPTSTLYWHEK